MKSDILLFCSKSENIIQSNLTPLRVENGRLRNDSGYLHWSGISDFYLPKYYGGEFPSRVLSYKSLGRNGVRVFCSVNNNQGNYLFDVDRLDWTYNNLIKCGLYMEPCLFADAQRNYPTWDMRAEV